MAARVVEGLERIQVHHQHRERCGAAGPDGIPEIRLERSVVADAGEGVVLGPHADLAVGLGILERDRGLSGEQLGEVEFVGAEERLRLAHAADVERADRLAPDEQRDHDHRLGLERGAGHLDGAGVEVRLVGQHRLAVVDDPAADADAERALVGEDQVGEAVAGDDRAAHAGSPVHAIDGQRVVRDDDLERIGDQVKDAVRLEGREQALVDLEQAPLARELVLQLGLLALEPADVGRVDQRLGGVAGEDPEGGLVIRVEAVPTTFGDDDHAVDDVLEGHRDGEHRLRLVVRAHDHAARVRTGIACPDRDVVGRGPAGQALADRDAEHRRVGVGVAQERALEGDRLAHPGRVVDAVDPDRVVIDQAAGLTDDGRRDALDVMDPVEADGQLRDRGEPLGEGVRRRGEPRVLHRDRDVVPERAGEVRLVVRPLVIRAVVEDQETQGLVAEHDGHEAHRLDALCAVHALEAGHGAGQVAGEDRHMALAERGHAGGLGVARQ